MRRLHLGTWAIGLTACGMTCTADPVFVEYCGQGELGGFVSVNFTGFVPNLVTTGPIWAGHNKQIVGGHMTHSYGLDVFREAGTGDHDVDKPHFTFDQHTRDALHALFNATNGGQVETNREAVAFQAVLWELVTDFQGSASSVDLHAGSLRISAGIDESLFNSYKSAAFDPNRSSLDGNLRVLSRGGFQRQALVMESPLMSVPLPGGAALALAGLGLIACRRARN